MKRNIFLHENNSPSAMKIISGRAFPSFAAVHSASLWRIGLSLIGFCFKPLPACCSHPVDIASSISHHALEMKMMR